jgi:precorrin-6A/cobalt-precorrin-6A reductase
MPALRLMILGGTAEAAALAAAAIERFGDGLEVISSFAGRVDGIRPPPGRIRIGGFGGAAGLAHYIKSEAIDLLVDATHPFAREISLNARLAAETTGLKRLVLWRPPWPRHPLDRWIEVDGLDGAARALFHLGRRVWLTVGAGELQPFAALADRWFLVRLVEAKGALPLADYTLIESRGPFRLEGERALIRQHRIDVLVTKASGGAATYAKLEAAREADLPVVMVRRPLPEAGERVDTVDAALDWIATRL